MDPLNDPILARARLLIGATSPVGNFGGSRSEGSKGVYAASVINGSTLINTHEDIRPFIQRGDQIIVDNNLCTTSSATFCQWSANCIELAHDYPGDTNFEAQITTTNTDDVSILAQNAKKGKKKIVPIASADIQSALEGLSAVTDFCSKMSKNQELAISSPKKIPKKKTRKEPYSTYEYEQYTSAYTPEEPYYNTPSVPSSNSNYNTKIDIRSLQKNNNPSHSNTPLKSAAKSTVPPTGVPTHTGRTEHTSHTSRKEENEPIPSSLNSIADDDGSMGADPLSYMTEFENKRKTTLTVDETYALAKKRVQQKIKADMRAKEIEDKEKERKRLAVIEASEAKVISMKEKTLARVAKYKESLVQREEEEKKKLQARMEEMREKELQLASPTMKKKMLEVRKQAKQRLRRHQLTDEKLAYERDIEIKSKLEKISKKMDITSTYLPPVQPFQKQGSYYSNGSGTVTIGSARSAEDGRRPRPRMTSVQEDNTRDEAAAGGGGGADDGYLRSKSSHGVGPGQQQEQRGYGSQYAAAHSNRPPNGGQGNSSSSSSSSSSGGSRGGSRDGSRGGRGNNSSRLPRLTPIAANPPRYNPHPPTKPPTKASSSHQQGGDNDDWSDDSLSENNTAHNTAANKNKPPNKSNSNSRQQPQHRPPQQQYSGNGSYDSYDRLEDESVLSDLTDLNHARGGGGTRLDSGMDGHAMRKGGLESIRRNGHNGHHGHHGHNGQPSQIPLPIDIAQGAVHLSPIKGSPGQTVETKQPSLVQVNKKAWKKLKKMPLIPVAPYAAVPIGAPKGSHVDR